MFANNGWQSCYKCVFLCPMTFVSPLFLWALAAVSIPVIIHLFNFRKYKKVYFSNVRFLKELQQESKSKSRLKEILILLCRCLTLVCLVLAFSQPVIPSDKNAALVGQKNAVSIYIDNSFSMENVSKQGPLLQIAKSQAKLLVNAFGNSDKFQIITNDFEGKHQRFYTKEDVLGTIEDIQITPAVRLLSDVVKRQSEFLAAATSMRKKIFVLSDAQRSTFDLEKLSPDTTIKIVMVPLQANQINNVSVDSCWFDTPLQQQGFIQKLHATLVNSGEKSLDVGSAKLYLNGKQIALTSFSLDANSKTEVQFTFENKVPGFNFGSIKIEDYPVAFDDELFFSFNSEVNVAVTLINGRDQKPENPFSSLFKGDSLFQAKVFSEQAIDYSVFKSSDVIVLNQLTQISSGLASELLNFTKQGGVLTIVPASSIKVESYNQLLTEFKLPILLSLDSVPLRTDKIEYASKFYSGVFEKVDDKINLPLVNKHYTLQKTTSSDFENILALQNGDPFLISNRFNNAGLFLFTAPLDEKSSNFVKHALFVPTFYRLCFTSVKALPLFYHVSENVVIELKNTVKVDETPPHILQRDGKTDIIPEQKINSRGLFLYTRSQITEPGFYEVKRNENRLLPLAFNYSRKESDLKCYQSSELEEIVAKNLWHTVNIFSDNDENIGNQVRLLTEGKKLWKLFIILSLIFIAMEVALLRLLK